VVSFQSYDYLKNLSASGQKLTKGHFYRENYKLKTITLEWKHLLTSKKTTLLLNKAYILVPCFSLLLHAHRDINPKRLNFQHKNGCKGQQRGQICTSTISKIYVTNSTSYLVESFILVSKGTQKAPILVLFHSIYTMALFWSGCILIGLSFLYDMPYLFKRFSCLQLFKHTALP